MEYRIPMLVIAEVGCGILVPITATANARVKRVGASAAVEVPHNVRTFLEDQGFFLSPLSVTEPVPEDQERALLSIDAEEMMGDGTKRYVADKLNRLKLNQEEPLYLEIGPLYWGTAKESADPLTAMRYGPET